MLTRVSRFKPSSTVLAKNGSIVKSKMVQYCHRGLYGGGSSSSEVLKTSYKTPVKTESRNGQRASAETPNMR